MASRIVRACVVPCPNVPDTRSRSAYRRRSRGQAIRMHRGVGRTPIGARRIRLPWDRARSRARRPGDTGSTSRIGPTRNATGRPVTIPVEKWRRRFPLPRIVAFGSSHPARGRRPRVPCRPMACWDDSRSAKPTAVHPGLVVERHKNHCPKPGYRRTWAASRGRAEYSQWNFGVPGRNGCDLHVCKEAAAADDP